MAAHEPDPLADPAEGIGWTDLPERWKRRYQADPGNGVHEYRQALRREAASRRSDASRSGPRYRDRFLGPGAW
jgi:hypothetical protein